MTTEAFTGVDGTELATHDANWLQATGVMAKLVLNSNQLRCLASFDVATYYNGSTTDFSKVTVLGGKDANDRGGPCVRLSNGTKGYHAMLASPSGGNYTAMWLLRDGNYVDEKACSVSIASDHTVSISASGSGATVTLELFVDDVSLGTIADSSGSRITSGYSGFYVLADASGDVNILDDWTDSNNETSGSVCWGHSSGVTQENTRTFATNWTGTGSASGSGNAEILTIAEGQYMVSEVVNTGATHYTLALNQYAAGDTVTVKYRTGASSAACQAASYSTYSGSFLSEGFVQVRLEA
jgi:hypothetical protein